MTLRPMLVFVHVLGAVGLAGALAIEAAALAALRRAGTAAEARAWLGALTLPRRVGVPAMAATLASGVWLTATAWGHQPWIAAAAVALLAMAAAGGAISGRRVRRIRAAIAAEPGPELSEAFRSMASARPLVASLVIRVALGVGILALMTAKPDAAGSALVLALSAGTGVVAGALVPAGRAARRIETREA